MRSMFKQWKSVLVVVLFVLATWGMFNGLAAYKSDWKYGPGDLAEANCIQTAIDTLWDLLHGTGTATNATLVVTGTATSTVSRVGDSITVGTNVTVGGTMSATTVTATTVTGTLVRAAQDVRSYGYTADVSTNTSGQVYLTQCGTVNGSDIGGMTTYTGTFAVTYMGGITPEVFISLTSTQAAEVTSGNIVTPASNKFTIVWTTNFCWQARGRIK